MINGALPNGVRGMALTSLTCTGGGTTPWAAKAERISPASLEGSTICGWAIRTSSPAPVCWICQPAAWTSSMR